MTGQKRPFMTSAEVAAALGISSQWFHMRRRELIEDQAFPVPMPHRERPMLFRRDMVEAWIAERGRPKALPPPGRPEGHNIVLMEKARTA